MEIIISTLTIILCISLWWNLRMRRENSILSELEDDIIITKERLEQKDALAQELQTQLDTLSGERDLLTQQKHALNTEYKLALQRLEQKEAQMHDWEKVKQEHMQAAKASVAQAATQLSNKLLDDHKRENESQKKQTEERISHTTKHFEEQFSKIFGSMQSLHDNVKDMDDIRKALLTPTGAGSIGEITLENIFKASHLTKDRDYFTQLTFSHHESGNTLRPDAVIRLPDNNFIVIDSKSSSRFFEPQDANNDAKNYNAKLKTTANKHLKDLMHKDYQEGLRAHLRTSYDIKDVGHVSYVMFFPTDVAIEKILFADPHFMENAWRAHIMPTGPAGLVNIIMNAKMLITNSQQIHNLDAIKDEVQKLIGSVATMHGYSEQMGRSLKGAMNKYDEFAGSFNHNFLSKIKRIDKMGIAHKKTATLIPLERYRVDEIGKLLDASATTQEEDADTTARLIEAD